MAGPRDFDPSDFGASDLDPSDFDPSDLGSPEGFAAAVVELGVREILASEDFDALRGSVRTMLQSTLPAQAQAGLESLVTHLSLSIWNATPLPSRGFRTAPIDPPGRNDRCLCGSGKKTKACCGTLRGAGLEPITPEEMWPIVLELLPASRLGEVCEVASRRLPPAAVGALAQRMLAEDSPRAALALVEPLFAPPGKRLARLDDRYADALDALLEAYVQLELHEQAAETIARLAEELRPPFRAHLWKHRAAAEASARNWPRAWEAFACAASDDPDDPSLAALELTMLFQEGRREHVRERAAFWLARLERRGLDDDRILELLRDCVEDPDRGMVLGGPPVTERWVMERFWDLVQEAKARPLPRYALDTRRAESRLRSPRGTSRFEQAWRKVHGPVDFELVELAEPSQSWMPEEAEEWLSLLESRPEGLDSLMVLSDLVEDAMTLPALGAPWHRTGILLPLLGRAHAVIRSACDRARDEAHELPPLGDDELAECALVLLVLYALQTELDGRDPLPVHELMLELDPGDEYGVSEHVVKRRMDAGDYRAALDVIERVDRDDDDDELDFHLHVDLDLVAALAHFAVGDRDAAREALAEIEPELSPLVIDALTGREIVEPSPSDAEPFASGAEVARDEADKIRKWWEAVDGALEWLRAAREEMVEMERAR